MAITGGATNNALDYGDISLFDGANTLTISVWVRITSWTVAWETILHKSDAGSYGWTLQRLESTNAIVCIARNAASGNSANYTFTPGTSWQHILAFIDGVTGDSHIWINGANGADGTDIPTQWNSALNTAPLTAIASATSGNTAIADLAFWVNGIEPDAPIASLIYNKRLSAKLSPLGHPDFYDKLLNTGSCGNIIGGDVPTLTDASDFAHPPIIYPSNNIIQLSSGPRVNSVSTDDDVPDDESPWAITGARFGVR